MKKLLAFYLPLTLLGSITSFVLSCKKEDECLQKTVWGVATDNITKSQLENVDIGIRNEKGQVSTQTKTKVDGTYEILTSSVVSLTIIYTKAGFYDVEKVIQISGGEPCKIEYNVSMIPQKQISFDPPSSFTINANEKSKTVNLKNIGNQGPIKVIVQTDPTAQWLTLFPKDPVVINQNATGQFIIAVDSKGKELSDYTAKIVFEYRSNDIVLGSETYVITMRVTSLPVQVVPAISSVIPLSGGYDTDVIISGQNFETDTSKVQVLFVGNKKALITSATSTELKVKVPVGAQTGNIRVRIGQQDAVSNAVFTYNLTCTLNTIVSLKTMFYINDIATASDGTIYVAGVEIKSNPNELDRSEITRSAIYRITKGSAVETALLEREAGFVNGSLASVAKMVNPTKLEVVGNDLYVADQYNAKLYKANYAEGYTSIRRISNGEITSQPAPYYSQLTNKEYINELLYIPKYDFNGILFSDGIFKKYAFNGETSDLNAGYQGFTAFMAFDGAEVYTLDLEPENNPTKWVLRKRIASSSPPLQSSEIIASDNLGIVNASTAPDKTNYPKSMAIDPINKYAYIFDRNSNFGYMVYRINLNNGNKEIIYNESTTSFGDGLLGSKGRFAAISCSTYDESRKAILLVDAFQNNKIRSMECK